MSEEVMIRRDRMRFTKNTLSSRLALLAIVFNVLFFISIYKVNYKDYYTGLMGISIIYNLVFMLAAFLASEGVKNYKFGYSFVLIALGIGQLVRILVYPRMMIDNPEMRGAAVLVQKVVTTDMGSYTVEEHNTLLGIPQHIRVIAYLALSAGCLAAGAVINLHRSRMLAAHNASLSLKQE